MVLSDGPGPLKRTAGNPWLGLAGVATAGLSILAAFGFVRVWLAHRGGYYNLNDAYFFRQDALLLGTVIVIWLVAAWPLRLRLADRLLDLAARADRRFAAAAALAVLAAAWAGAAFLVGPVRLSGDEFFADFDARIFAAGRLAAPIPMPWRAFAGALQPIYARVTPDGSAWSSVDLPIHSLIRAGFMRVGLADLAGAILAGACVVLVWRLARRLWPERRDAAVVAVAVLAASPQFLLTAMTPFAMTAGLALDLAWLSLILVPRAGAQIAAAAIALVACGLHKWLPAPLFAAPFLVWAWSQGRRGAAAFGAAAFAASGAFWIASSDVRLMMLGYPLSGPGAGWAEIGRVLKTAGWSGAPLIMAENLVRFGVWQSPAALPLALAATGRPRRFSLLAALAAGPVLATVVFTLIFPFQGHGWGFRYLHDYLGSVSLLAAAGWVRLTAPSRRAAVLAWALGALVILPADLAVMRADLDRFAAVQDLIARSDADVVLVDTESQAFANDFVRNDPFLANRPKIMELDDLTAAQVQTLASRYRVERFAVGDGRACFAAVSPSSPSAAEQCRPAPPGPLS